MLIFKSFLKKFFDLKKKYSASIAMDIYLRQLTCKINLRQMPCKKSVSNDIYFNLRQMPYTKSASNAIYFNLRQMPCTKSASNAMQKLKCVKSPCVNCHAKFNLRQMPLRQKSLIVHLSQMSSRDKTPGVKIPALKFRASNIFCVKRVPPHITVSIISFMR